MAHADHTKSRLLIGSTAQLEGPADYLESISTCLLALLAAVLAGPVEFEQTLVSAFTAQAESEGLDADDVGFLLMSCTLIDDREDGDREAA